MLTRTKPVRRQSAERAAERREYAKRRKAYLAAHPFDQVAIALFGLDEATIIRAGEGRGFVEWAVGHDGVAKIWRSDQIHHRLKCHGARLNDERWWMATNLGSHEFIENNKGFAREHGFLLPIQANADGEWGDGQKALPTEAFMRARAGK